MRYGQGEGAGWRNSRPGGWRPALLRVVPMIALLGCSDPTAAGPVVRDCPGGAAWNASPCADAATREVLEIPTDWTEDGSPVTLVMFAYIPRSPGPHPTMVFHHGSTGSGADPSRFAVPWESGALASFLVDRGWMVLFPQRRGRGGSGGLYDEGFTPDRTRYSCDAGIARSGLERALEDAEAVTAFVATRSEVDPRRLVVGGFSRGGVLAAVHARRSPQPYRAVVNFVGGWLGEGCGDAETVNRSAFAESAAQINPVLWLYGANDSFYGAAYSQANFETFLAAGGTGSFHLYRRGDPTADGHFIINEPALWARDLERFLTMHANG